MCIVVYNHLITPAELESFSGTAFMQAILLHNKDWDETSMHKIGQKV